MGRRKRGWNIASALSITDLQRLVEEKLSQVESLASRRAAITAELEAIDTELAAAGGGVSKRRGRKPGPKPGRRGPGRPPKNGRRRGPGRPPKAGRRGPGRPPRVVAAKAKPGRKPGPKGQSDLHNAIRVVLKSSSEPMKTADIAAKVKEGGYETKSKVFHLIVGQRLAEMADVLKPERGLYALKAD
jgi:hypothetical protein